MRWTDTCSQDGVFRSVNVTLSSKNSCGQQVEFSLREPHTLYCSAHESWGIHHSQVQYDVLALLLVMVRSKEPSVGWKIPRHEADLGGTGLHT